LIEDYVMPSWKYCLVLFTIAVVGAAAPAHSQSPPPAAPAPVEPAAPAADKPPAADKAKAPTAPSAETLKRAKAVGLRPEVRKSGTVYCWEDASTGTRFTTKKCVDENQLDDMIAQREAQQDKMRRAVGSQ
jgi:hypothetical protein